MAVTTHNLAKTGKSRNWIFTINNYTDADDPKQWVGVKFLAFQAERAETTGTPHYQGYVMFHKEMRLAALKKVNGRAYWAPRMGTHEQALAYNTKTGTRVDGPWIIGTPPAQGKRTDLDAVFKDIKDGVPERKLWDTYPRLMLTHDRAFQRYRSLQQQDRSRAPTVILHYGKSGTGKNTWVKNNLPIGEDAYWKDACHNWWEGYANQPHVVIDEFSGWLPYSFLKRLLDEYPIQVDVKGGHIRFNSPYIHIISNEHPNSWYDDKYDWMQIHRRINKAYEHIQIGTEPKVMWDHSLSPLGCSYPDCPVIRNTKLLAAPRPAKRVAPERSAYSDEPCPASIPANKRRWFSSAVEAMGYPSDSI